MFFASRPTRVYEKRLHAAGYMLIAGVDEVGRGAWAGPLLACAVIMPLTPRINGIRDSKMLSPKKRKKLAEKIKRVARAWAIGVARHEEIDRLGISVANHLAIERAVAMLGTQPDHVLVDAFKFFYLPLHHTAIPHGDAIVYSIAAASIIAKVTRDKMMNDYDLQYPHFQFARHKGYGTPEHHAALCMYGPTPIHRKSFQPIARMVE